MPAVAPRRLTPLLAAAAVLALLAAACSSGADKDGPVLTPVQARYLPQTVSSELAVGPNRFMVGLVDQEQSQPVIGAQLHFRFFKLDGNEATLKFEMDANAIRVTKTYTHTHADGTVETHSAGEVGVYVANVDFDSAGQWGVEVSGAVQGDKIEPVRPTFTVLEKSLSPTVGDPAPRSRQPILGDPGFEDIAALDTSDPPNPDMHSMTIADAVASGRPTVIVFATPAFCISQICGPTKEVVDELYQKYQGQANFVHVEPYDLEKARSGEGLVPQPFLTEEWHLQSEPWVFVVDSQGVIAAKFQAVVTLEELEAALTPLLDANAQ